MNTKQKEAVGPLKILQASNGSPQTTHVLTFKKRKDDSQGEPLAQRGWALASQGISPRPWNRVSWWGWAKGSSLLPSHVLVHPPCLQTPATIPCVGLRKHPPRRLSTHQPQYLCVHRSLASLWSPKPTFLAPSLLLGSSAVICSIRASCWMGLGRHCVLGDRRPCPPWPCLRPSLIPAY